MKRKYMHFRLVLPGAPTASVLVKSALEMTRRHGANSWYGHGASDRRVHLHVTGASSKKRRPRGPSDDPRQDVGVLPVERACGRPRLERDRWSADRRPRDPGARDARAREC